jgi:hypothetical protein
VSSSRALLFGSAALALALLVWSARAFWPFTVDDTFISLRYAKHVAEGLGPTWNPGGPRVEGYTTVLWMVLLALPHALGIDALLFAKCAGVLCTFASIVVASLLAAELARTFLPPARRLAALFPFALAAAYWPLALHAISGMESALAALLLTSFCLVSVRHMRAPSARRSRTLALLSLACTLTRPEAGFACGAALLLALALTVRSERRALVRAVALYCALPGALYFVARYLYFGLLFPLPFYVKATGQERFAGLEEVQLFFLPFIWPRPYLLLALYGALRHRALYPALLGLGAFAAFFVFPAHIMGFEGRYLVPIVPSLAALMASGLAKLSAPLFARLAGRAPRFAPLPELAIALAVWVLIAPFRFPAHEAEARTRWLAYGDGLRRAHMALAEALRSNQFGSDRRAIALLDVGAVAYYSEWFTIDTYGLNDRRVALSRRRDIAYIFAQRPALVVVVSLEPKRYAVVFDWEQPIYDAARARGYHQVASYEFLPDYHLLVLARSP